jgi:hypothetical protein
LPTFPWPTTNELERPSVGAGNFNHGLYLEVNKRRKADAIAFVRERPGDYLQNVVFKGLPQFFEPTTHWHPKDREVISPHYQHHQVLGGFENAYNWILHRSIAPLAPFGLYCTLPFVLGWVLWRLTKALRAHWSPRSEPKSELNPAVLFAGYLAFQIAFVAVPSILFTLGESARYRYMSEPLIWLLTASFVSATLALRKPPPRANAAVARGPDSAV